MAIQVGFFGYRALVNKPLTSYFKDFTVSVLFYIAVAQSHRKDTKGLKYFVIGTLLFFTQ